MGLKGENIRLKLALLDMVRQFYEYALTPKIAENIMSKIIMLTKIIIFICSNLLVNTLGEYLVLKMIL